MPSRNSVKIFIENGYYHLYNRGVDKSAIFREKNDCIVFLRFLKQYLSPKDDLQNFLDPSTRLDRIIRSNMHGEIELLSFALMPNHFHLLVKQSEVNGISKFMIRLCTAYAMYFNKKYKRTGHLFQDQYKGALILDDGYLLHLSRYIHLNPIRIPKNVVNFNEFTSYPYYLGTKKSKWINTNFILGYFSQKFNKGENSYKNFVDAYRNKNNKIKEYEEIAIDSKDKEGH